MATRASEAASTEAKVRADANFKKEERIKEGARAMMEYQAAGRVIRERTARLKALRLAKEADEKGREQAAKPKAKVGKAGKIGKA